MKKYLSVLVASWLLILVFPLSQASAESPTDFVRGMLDKVMAIQNNPDLQGASHRNERRIEIKKIIAQSFDFNSMGREALGEQWKRLTPAQQKEFVGVFQDLFQDSYTKLVLDFLKQEKILYTAEKPTGQTAQVQTSILRTNEKIAVDYSILKNSERWLVRDVSIDGVSIVRNYQRSFDRVIQRESYQSLLKKMRLQQQTIEKSSGTQKGSAAVPDAGSR